MPQPRPSLSYRARAVFCVTLLQAFGACGFPSYSTPDQSSGADAGAAGCGSLDCAPCPEGFADCDALADNGCETQLGTDTDCSACAVSCTNDHGLNACVVDDSLALRSCGPSCILGFDDCDLRPDNGCETNVNQDSLNCGRCGAACPGSGGTPLCVAGKCGVSSCNQGFGDCSNAGSCSFNLTTDPQNCGQCGHVCSAEHGTPRCNAAVCELDCDAGYGDCNGGPTVASPPNDGCETKLNVPDSTGNVADCGACGTACVRRAFTTVNLQKCAEGVCFRDCWADAYDCDDRRNDPSCNGSACGCEFTPCN